MRGEIKPIARDCAVVVLCWVAAGTEPLRRLDDRAFEELHRRMASSRKWRALWWILSQPGWFGSAIVVSLALAKKGNSRAAIRALIAASVAWSAAQVIKKATQLDRPWDRLEGVERTGGIPAGTAFPSGHPAVAAAVAGSIAADTSTPFWLRAITRTASLVVPPARIGVGAHYPLDVVAGYFLGDLVARLVRLLMR